MCKLTSRETQIINGLLKSDVKTLANELGIKPNTVNTILHRIRVKRKKAKALEDQLKAYSNKSEKLKRLLIPTERMAEKWE